MSNVKPAPDRYAVQYLWGSKCRQWIWFKHDCYFKPHDKDAAIELAEWRTKEYGYPTQIINIATGKIVWQSKEV